MSKTFNKPDATLADAKRFLGENWEDGVDCPCCEQLVKLYKRKLNKSMAYVLALIYRWHRSLPDGHQEWLHVPSHIAAALAANPVQAAAVRGDWAKLKHWGVIEQFDGVRDDGSDRVGFYRITDLGIAFVRGEVALPAHVFIYNGDPIDIPVEKSVFFRDTLDVSFNYAELMAA